MKKAKILKKLIQVLIIVAAVLPLLAYYHLTIDDGQWEEDEKGNPSTYTQNVKTPTADTGDNLTLDKEAIVKQGLKDLNYQDEDIDQMTDEEIIKNLRINKKLHKTPPVTSLDEVTEAEILWCSNDVYSKYLKKPEELEKLLKAEIITQYPDFGQEDAELNGIIKFERHKEDGTSQFLKYIDSTTFSNYVESNDDTALDYFTLDEEGNAVIAYSNSVTETLTSNDDQVNFEAYATNLSENDKKSDGSYSRTTVNCSTVSINYKSAVEKYTMPFTYLWSLLVIGEDRNFVLELADLVEKSEITISIYDNVTTTEDVNTYTYKKETRTDKYARLSVQNAGGVLGYGTERYWLSKDSPEAAEHYSSKFQATYEKDDTEYTITDTLVNKTNTIVYDLTKANVWIVDYSKEYTFPDDVSSTVDENSADIEDTEYVFNSKTSKTSNDDAKLLEDTDAVSFAESVKSYIERNLSSSNTSTTTSNTTTGNTTTTGSDDEVSVSVIFVKLNKYDHNVERKKSEKITTTEQKYVAKTPINNPKVDKNSDEDNFVTILRKKSHSKARTDLTDGITTGWLWDILEYNNPNMVDLTKFLFYKAIGKSFGVDTYDFGEYTNTEFLSTGSVGGSLSLTTPVLTKEQFEEALKSYSTKLKGDKKTNFDTNFLPYAGDIYDWSKAAGVNPELVIITASTEQAFKAGGGTYNYWGISVTNGSSSGSSFSSLKEGIEGYASVIKSFQTGSKAEQIKARAVERQAAGVDPTGYGSPDTLSGMQSLYSFLGKHEEGSSGSGGYYYMDPDRAGVTRIYKTHQEFLSLCKDSGKPEHAAGTVTTVWEQGQYTAYQVEQKLDVWDYIFGDYGSLSGGNQEVVEIAKTKLGCKYVYGSNGPNEFDCSGLVEWVFKQKGITVPRSTGGYKDYVGTATEISWSEAQPGDILIIFKEERSTTDGHAGIYLGNDQYIHAPRTGDVVKISSGATNAFKHVFRFK